MKFIPRSRWKPRGGVGPATTRPQSRVVFHHAPERQIPDRPTHDQIAEQIRIMEDWQIQKFTHRDPRLSYQWIIVVPTREIWEGIGWDRIGAHVADHNTASLGVLFLGLNGAVEAGPDSAWELAAEIVREGIRRGSLVPRPELSPHRRYVATSCPGDVLTRHVEQLTLDELLVLLRPEPWNGPPEDDISEPAITMPPTLPDRGAPERVVPWLDRDAAALAVEQDIAPKTGEPARRWICRVTSFLSDHDEIPTRVRFPARLLRSLLDC